MAKTDRLNDLAARCVNAANDVNGPKAFGLVDVRVVTRFGGHVVVWEATLAGGGRRWSAESVESEEKALEDLLDAILAEGSSS